MNSGIRIILVLLISVSKDLQISRADPEEKRTFKEVLIEKQNQFNSIWDSAHVKSRLIDLEQLTELLIHIASISKDILLGSADFKEVENVLIPILNKTALVYSQVIGYKRLPTSYATLVSTINEVFDKLAENSEDPQRQENFRKAFKELYAMTGSSLVENVVAPKDNTLQIYRDQVQCNTVQLQALCLHAVVHVMKGQLVEGGYYLMTEQIEKLRDRGNVWMKDMKLLEEKCEDIVDECSSQWRDYAKTILDEVYNKHFTETKPSKKNLAEKLYSALSSRIPQRIWAVWVYDKSAGFGEHTVSSPNVHIMRWHENRVTVTIAGFKETNSPLSEDTFSTIMEALSKNVGDDCKEGIYTWPFSQKTGPYMDKNLAAKNIVMFVEHELAQFNSLHLVYAIRISNDVSHVAAPNRSFVYDLRRSCVRFPFHVFIFQ